MDECKFISFNANTDIRGKLIPIQSNIDVPFNISRIFFIKNLDELPRGFHSHKKTIQVIFPLCGSFDIELTDGQTIIKHHLDTDDKGLLIPINWWLHMYDFSMDCIVAVICSYKYDETEYIRNYGDFLEYAEEIKKNKVVEYFSLFEQTQQLKEKVLTKINNIIDNNSYVLGQDISEFEHKFAEYNNVKYCVGLSNGTSALITALKALKLNDGDEIIIQSNTYIAAPLAIEFCNLKIKIVDIDSNLNLDLNLLADAITDKTKAVIVVHLYGMCPDMDVLIDLKNKYNFKLIEDTAQAHGSEFNDQKLGTFGDIGCFSFYPSKNLGSFGEGGCIITNDSDHADFAKLYRNYGSVEKYKWEIKGTNERMHNIQAGILNIKLPYLDKWNSQRRNIAQIYNKQLSDITEIIIPTNHPKLQRNYHIYIIIANDRDNLLKYLNNKNISVAIHYPETFYKSNAFQELNHLTFQADNIKNNLLSLPMYPEMPHSDAEIVSTTIREFYNLHI
jgi:dTDP-4-amino-4,6-dideoxygalactose transaminase